MSGPVGDHPDTPLGLGHGLQQGESILSVPLLVLTKKLIFFPFRIIELNDSNNFTSASVMT